MKLSSYVIKSILLILIVISGNIRPGDAAPVTPKALAPAFRVTSLDGQVFDLADLHGKVVVLNLWFIGCPPCRKEIPELNNLVEEFKGKDVVFLALALDRAEELRAFIKEQPFNYNIVPEAKQVIKRYGGWVYPKHIIINKEGRIEWVKRGGGKHRYEDLRSIIERLLS